MVRRYPEHQALSTDVGPFGMRTLDQNVDPWRCPWASGTAAHTLRADDAATRYAVQAWRLFMVG